MKTATYTDLRKNLKHYLDAVANNSERIIIPREGGKGVMLVSIDDDDSRDCIGDVRDKSGMLVPSPAMLQAIEEAQADIAAGRVTLYNGKEELRRFLDSL